MEKEPVRRIEKLSFRASVITGVASLFIALIYGFWGIKLANRQIELSNKQIELSKEQNSTSIAISHFDSLLRKMDSSINIQISTSDTLITTNKKLSTQISILDSQLHISQSEQSVANKNSVNTNTANEAKLFVAMEKIHLLLWDMHNRPPLDSVGHINLSDYDSTERFSFLNKTLEALEGQLSNPFLLSRKTIFNDWMECYVLINGYRMYYNFMPETKELNNKWMECYDAISDLEQNLYSNFAAKMYWHRKVKHTEVTTDIEDLFKILKKARGGNIKR